jgi:hypothetical protein
LGGIERHYRKVPMEGGGIQYQVISLVGFNWRHVAVVNVVNGKASRAERYFYSIKAPEGILPFEPWARISWFRPAQKCGLLARWCNGSKPRRLPMPDYCETHRKYDGCKDELITDLVKACKLALTDLPNRWELENTDVLDAIEAAIAKTEGKVEVGLRPGPSEGAAPEGGEND